MGWAGEDGGLVGMLKRFEAVAPAEYKGCAIKIIATTAHAAPTPMCACTPHLQKQAQIWLLGSPSRPKGREGAGGESGGSEEATKQSKSPSQRIPQTNKTKLKGSNPRLRPPQDQRMDIVRTFVSIHNLQINQMPRHPKLIRDAVAPHHVPRQPRNIQ